MDSWILVDHQNAALFTGRLGRCRWLFTSLRRIQRQGDPELGAAFRRRLVGKCTTMSVDQAVAQRETQSGSLTGSLRGEKWGEQIGSEVLGNSGPGISHA